MRKGNGLLDTFQAQQALDEALDSHRDASGSGMEFFEIAQKGLIEGWGLAVTLLALAAIPLAALTLKCGIGEFAEGVTQFDTLPIDLEAFTEKRITGALPRQGAELRRVVPEKKRALFTEPRLDILNHDLEEGAFKVIINVDAGMLQVTGLLRE